MTAAELAARAPWLITPPKPTGPGPYVQKSRKVYTAHGLSGWIMPQSRAAVLGMLRRGQRNIRVTTLYYWEAKPLA